MSKISEKLNKESQNKEKYCEQVVMKHFLLLAIIGILFLGFTYGASVATEKLKASNCTKTEGFQAIACVLRMADFAQKIEKLDMDDKNQVNEFEKSCVSLANCFESVQCGPEDPDEKKTTQMIKNYCDAVVYVAKDFAGCSEKLENKNSTCYQNWDPFPDAIDEETDEKKKEKMLQEACKNYFGKDNCLKKEITEKCSETEWKGFRDHFIGISNILLECDFSNIQ